MRKKDHVCPMEKAGHLDSRLRKWAHPPKRILAPYLKEGMQALDVGCGPGAFSLEMARLVGEGGRVVAADLQSGMLDIIRKKIAGTNLEDRIHLHQCQKEAMALEHSFDFCLAFYVVHELPSQEAFFQELSQRMKSGGEVLIAEPTLFHVSRKAFRKSLEMAHAAGFTAKPGPRILLSHTALLSKQ